MEIISKIVSFNLKTFISDFEAWNYFFIERENLWLYLLFVDAVAFFIYIYLGTIYDIKKSSIQKKYIRKEYPIYKWIFLIHWYENIYKKVDRFWFDIAYRGFFIHWGLFGLVMGLAFFSKYFPFPDSVVAVCYVCHLAYMLIATVAHFLGTTYSSSGPWEFRDEKKYRKKNW